MNRIRLALSFCFPSLLPKCCSAVVMAKIKLSRVSAVVPAIPTVKHRMFLSNLDLFWIPVNQVQRLLFYKTSPENQFSTVVEKLKSSLSSVLVDFYPLAGRLVRKGEDQSGRPEVDCNDGGVAFIEASIEMHFQDMEKEDFQYKSFFKQLVATHTDGLQHEGYDAHPLLSIQVTDFRGGGICIGATLHHVIADGNSFWHFMKSWAERSRGLPISMNPEHMRTIFKRDEKNYTIPNISLRAEEVISEMIKEAQILKFLPDDFQPINSEPAIAHEKEMSAGDASMKNSDQNSFLSSIKDETDLETATFNFSEGMIRNLKERTGATTPYVAVAAHFWRCVVKAREIPEKEPVVLGLLADCRSRVKPPLRCSYFGNCLCVGTARTTAQQLLKQDVCFAAALIHEVISSCTSTEVQLNNMIDFLDESPGSGFARFLTQLSSVTRYGVNVVSSPKFPVYELDYGWGKPLSVQTASINELGAMVLFPGRDTEGKSIDLATCLPRHQMKTLKQILMTIPE